MYLKIQTEPIKKKRKIVNTQAINLIGNRYGRWVVAERAENTPNGSAKWLCKCDCGEKRIVAGLSLRSGKSKSCGCFHKEQLRNKKGENHPSYKTGSIINHQGYIWFLTEIIRILVKEDTFFNMSL